MERLPYIDEHGTRIDATPDAVWTALVSVLASQFDAVPRPIKRAWGLTPSERRGDWSGTVQPGDAIPGFAVAEAQHGERLALRGTHHFSRYQLVFDLEPVGAAACRLRARSWAAFPGVKGAGYRALVIGTRGHRFAVRRLVKTVASRA